MAGYRASGRVGQGGHVRLQRAACCELWCVRALVRGRVLITSQGGPGLASFSRAKPTALGLDHAKDLPALNRRPVGLSP